MTRAEQPETDAALPSPIPRERAAVRAPAAPASLRRLWSAQLVGGTGDALAVLVLIPSLGPQAAVTEGGARRRIPRSGVRRGRRHRHPILAAVLFGARVLLGRSPR